MIMPGFGAVNQVPLYCANCHKDAGWVVPEENCTFAFYLCDPCGEKWGTQYGTLLMPDELFWEKVKQEQLEKYGRFLTQREIATAEASPTNSLGRLIREQRP